MASRGGQPGNTNAVKENRIFGDELRKVVAQDREKLRAAAEKLLLAASNGDLPAIKELRDTLDGRPAQLIAGHDGGALTFKLEAPWWQEVMTARGAESTDTAPALNS